MEPRAVKKLKALKRIIEEILDSLPVEKGDDVASIQRIKEKLYRSSTLKDFEKLRIDIASFLKEKHISRPSPSSDKKLKELVVDLGVSEKILSELKEAFIMLSTYLLNTLKNFMESSSELEKRIDEIKNKLEKVETSEDLYQIKNDVSDVIFKYLNLRDVVEKEVLELKDIVAYLGSTIEFLVSSTGGFSVKLGEYINQLYEASSLDEISRVKKAIITETEKLRDFSIAISKRLKELEQQTKHLQEKILNLQKKLDEVKEKVLLDPLTGIYNRKALITKLNEMLDLFKRKKRVFSFLMIDLDHFKTINDTYGHSIGDKVLKSAVSVMRKNLREYDELFRYGGEEFSAILPETDLKEAKKIAERLRRAVSSVSFVVKEERFSVTISIGVATSKPGDIPDSIIERSDKALYTAKRMGRNRVVSEEDI